MSTEIDKAVEEAVKQAVIHFRRGAVEALIGHLRAWLDRDTFSPLTPTGSASTLNEGGGE